MKEDFNRAAGQSDGRGISGDFNAAARDGTDPPNEPKPGMHLRPDGATVEAVHGVLERQGMGHVSPQLREDQIAQEFRRRMLVRQSFNRAAKGLEQEQGQDLER